MNIEQLCIQIADNVNNQTLLEEGKHEFSGTEWHRETFDEHDLAARQAMDKLAEMLGITFADVEDVMLGQLHDALDMVDAERLMMDLDVMYS